jgi:hypothetical protein
MIALRGILRQNEERKWTWEGVWSFGELPQDEQAALNAKHPSVRPFSYAWEESRKACNVLVPSADENLGNNEKSKEVAKKNDDAKVAAPDTTIETTTTPNPAEAANTPKENAPSQDVDMTETKGTSEVKEKEPEEATKSGGVEPMEVDKAADSNKLGSAASESKGADNPSAIEEKRDSTMSKDESSKRAVVFENQDKPKKEQVTFASTLPGEPPFTDADIKHPDKCPPGGAWKGYFETATNRKDKSTIQIPENFCLFFNATPANDARVLFLVENDAKQDSKALLPNGHIHVRGAGSNQYGTWELIGSLNVDSGVLECQRMYVRPDGKPKTPGRRGRPRKSEMQKKRVSIDFDETPSLGPRSTRKRQLSWRKRASLSDDDEPPRRPSTGTGKRGRPRKHSVDVTQAQTVVGKLFTPTGTMISIPAADNVAKRSPVTSPRVIPKTAVTGPKKRVKASPPTPTSSTVKLPHAGDPNEARWRAAHFLYYQRYDPSSDGEGGGGGEASTNFVVYEGDMSQGYCLRDGKGVALYNNGTLYEGDWKRNKEHGHGTLMTDDRKHVIYKGEWERGRMHGTGVYYYFQEKDPRAASRRKQQDSSTDDLVSRYEGEFRENVRHGDGKYVLPNGAVYEGEWREDLMSGRGTFRWPDGSVYIGSWKDGKRNGSGILQASDGFTYDGNWVQNAMEGRGIATYPGGQRYEGMWTQGRREGRGSIHFANGAVYEGRFRDDCMEGSGTMKMMANAPIPRRSSDDDEDEGENVDEEDWMIPISFQSDMGHIHQKAGFTVEGE